MTSTTERAYLERPAQLDEILRVQVGSHVHGTAVEGTDDEDQMGIFIQPAGQLLGIDPPRHHDVWRTAEQRAALEGGTGTSPRSMPGDLDLVRYSLPTWMRLALEGNPSVLLPLYAPDRNVVLCCSDGAHLRTMAGVIVSRRAGHRFLGYANAQLERLRGGGRRPRVPKRPELIERYGYDTKYAGHALRLTLQGIELVSTGTLTLPMPDEQRDAVLAVRRGEHTQAQAEALIERRVTELADLLAAGGGPLREEPNREAVNAWMVGTTLRRWGVAVDWS